MYKDSEKYLSVLNNAHDLYRSEEGIQEKLYDLLHSLNLDDERIEKSRSKIEEIYYELEEEMDSLDKILGSFEEEDLSIDEIEERLFLYSKLKRKHNTDVKGLLALKGDYEAKIAFYNDRDHILLEKEEGSRQGQREGFEVRSGDPSAEGEESQRTLDFSGKGMQGPRASECEILCLDQ